MAVEELKAKISVVDDNATRNLDKITRAFMKQEKEMLRLKENMKKSREENKRFAKSLNEIAKPKEIKIDTRRAETNVRNLTRSLSNLSGAMGRVMGGLGRGIGGGMLFGGAGVVAGGYAGKQVFDRTVGAAAKYEVSEKTIQSMFGNKKQSQAYLDFVNQKALSSPLLNSTDMFSNSGMFVSKTQNLNQLKKIWSLAERLTARNMDPSKGGGLEGAAYTLSEAFSGDLGSLKDRFGLKGPELKGIGNMSTDKQLAVLDKFFNKNKMTQSLINDMGDTTLGTWNQIGETVSATLRKIGGPANKVIGDYLKNINKMIGGNGTNKFVTYGQKIFEGIAKGFVKVSNSVGKWIDDIVNSPAWAKANGMSEKFQVVLDDVYAKFNGWYEEKGKGLMSTIAEGLTAALITGFKKNSKKITSVGLDIGGAIVQGIGQAIEDSPMAKAILGGYIAGPIGAGAALVDHFVNKTVDFIADPILGKKQELPEVTLFKKPKVKPGNFTDMDYRKAKNLEPHAFGLNRVPRNNYPALLHEGERVLTKQQANQQNNGAPGVNINIQNVNIKNESDYQNFVKRLVKDIQGARVSFGGSY